MKLEYRYGQTYLTDLHLGDMVPTWGWEYRIISANDIDENGCLRTNITISNRLEDRKDRDK